jgi:hypothetical protein
VALLLTWFLDQIYTLQTVWLLKILSCLKQTKLNEFVFLILDIIITQKRLETTMDTVRDASWFDIVHLEKIRTQTTENKYHVGWIHIGWHIPILSFCSKDGVSTPNNLFHIPLGEAYCIAWKGADIDVWKEVKWQEDCNNLKIRSIYNDRIL